MVSSSSFLLSAGAALALAVLHQIVLIWLLRDRWFRWFRHEPAFSLFLIVLFPVALGTLTATAVRPLSTFLQKYPWFSTIVFVVLLILLGILLVQDLNRRPFHPWLIRQPSGMLDIEDSIRTAVSKHDWETLKKDVAFLLEMVDARRRRLTESVLDSPPGHRPSRAHAGTCRNLIADLDKRTAAAQEQCEAAQRELTTGAKPSNDGQQAVTARYTNAAATLFFDAFPPLAGPLDIVKRGSIAVYTHIALNFLAVGTALLLFLTIFAILMVMPPGERTSFFRLLLVPTVLLIVWFPIRLYAEWYLEFERSDYCLDFQALVILALMAFLGAIGLLVLANPGSAETWLTVVGTIASAVATALAYLRPQSLAAVKRAMDRMTPAACLGVFVLVLIAAVGVALGIHSQPQVIVEP